MSHMRITYRAWSHKPEQERGFTKATATTHYVLEPHPVDTETEGATTP
jgi:hypothetical protein